jgi:ABC-type nitrate/sulfonate/bicarbonate transport system substrate-binding protein
MSAFVKGAGVHTISVQGTGSTSTTWFVPVDSPIKGWERELAGKTVAYSRPGSRTNMAVLDLIDYYKDKGWTPLPEAVSVGGPVDALAANLTGQVDVGWGAYPINWGMYEQGQTREILFPSLDLPGWKDLIVGVNVTMAKTLKEQPEVIRGWNRAWKRASDFTYSNTQEAFVILSSFSKGSMASEFTIGQFEKYAPAWGQTQDITGSMDKAMSAAVSGKFIDAPLTKAQHDAFFRLEYISK